MLLLAHGEIDDGHVTASNTSSVRNIVIIVVVLFATAALVYFVQRGSTDNTKPNKK